jgi:hypothetical protein
MCDNIVHLYYRIVDICQLNNGNFLVPIFWEESTLGKKLNVTASSMLKSP